MVESAIWVKVFPTTPEPTLDPIPCVATGGVVTQDGADTVHTFTADGSFVVTQEGWAEYCVVAPGGRGDGTQSAGGGGDVRTGWKRFTPGTYPVVVGQQGADAGTLGGWSNLGDIYAGPGIGGNTGPGAMYTKRPPGAGRGDANNTSAGGAGGVAVGQTPGPGVVFHGVEYGRGGRFGGTAEGIARHPGWGGNKAAGETAAQNGTVIVRYKTAV